MRLALVALLALTLGSTAAAAQSAQPAGSAETARRLDSLWAQMYATHDTTTAARLFADDVVITATDGTPKTKQAELGDVRPAPGLTMAYFRTRPSRVLAHDGVLVVAGVAEWEFTMGGSVRALRRSYTITYGRGGALGWQIVAMHMGPAPAG